MGTIANFLWLLGLIALLSVALRPGSQITGALNSTSGLISNSIKAAKS
jgi:hypothetical protein